jgi:hypothetical protein
VNCTGESCAIAFKEWASVCDAMLAGRQTIILRKGGISEGQAPDAFMPEHLEFWLYPTWVHQAEQGVREAPAGAIARGAPPRDGTVPIEALVRVDLLGYLDSEQRLRALEDHHILTAETVFKRFHYRTPGLWVLAARVCRAASRTDVKVTPEQAGCKTWVTLEEPVATSGVVPVLDDETWAERRRRLQAVLRAG